MFLEVSAAWLLQHVSKDPRNEFLRISLRVSGESAMHIQVMILEPPEVPQQGSRYVSKKSYIKAQVCLRAVLKECVQQTSKLLLLRFSGKRFRYKQEAASVTSSARSKKK